MDGDPDETIDYVFARAAKAVRNYAREELAEIGLHPGQNMLLLELYAEDGRRQGELADRLDVEPSAISKMVTRLESGGLVERRADEDDSRISRVYLTGEGRSLQGEIEDVHRRMASRMLEGFSTEEKALFRRMLVDVRDNLSESDHPASS